MSPCRRWMFAVLIATYAFGTSATLAADKKKEKEAAKHAAEKAAHEQKQREEHERKQREEAAKKAAHERKQHEAAQKVEHDRKQHETSRKAEQEQKQGSTAKNGEHAKNAKAESEARIAAARKHRAANPANKSRQTAHDKQIAGHLSKIAVSLHQADHDYDWQRHEAVELVRGALHDLHEPEPNTEGKFGGMTQKKSDQILKDNIPPLESLRSELSAKGAPTHHQAARQKIEEALSNLHAALKIN